MHSWSVQYMVMCALTIIVHLIPKFSIVYTSFTNLETIAMMYKGCMNETTQNVHDSPVVT